MKPYLRNKNIKGLGWKRDVHPPKGYMNWWEGLNNFVSRRKMKQRYKKIAEKMIAESKPMDSDFMKIVDDNRGAGVPIDHQDKKARILKSSEVLYVE